MTCTEEQLHFDWKYPKNKSAGPTAAEQKSIRLLVVQNREKLLEEWEEKVIVKEQM
ncbi:MAG TPA: hypothetical protein VK203_13575 [Nostocaceae cyanobacterium]|nr:hypothetical protein [Nostocaceae cyanobacterium]